MDKHEDNLKNVHFEKKARKLKNIIFYFMITFYNFEIETSWAKRMVQPISETRILNAIVSLVYSFLDNFFFKNMHCEKEF